MPYRTPPTAAIQFSASSMVNVSGQKSNPAPILKNRDCNTLVGRSQAAVVVVANVLFTVNGQLLLNTL